VEYRLDTFPSLNSITDMENQIQHALYYYIIDRVEYQDMHDPHDLIKMSEMSNALLPKFLSKV